MKYCNNSNLYQLRSSWQGPASFSQTVFPCSGTGNSSLQSSKSVLRECHQQNSLNWGNFYLTYCQLMQTGSWIQVLTQRMKHLGCSSFLRLNLSPEPLTLLVSNALVFTGCTQSVPVHQHLLASLCHSGCCCLSVFEHMVLHRPGEGVTGCFSADWTRLWPAWGRLWPPPIQGILRPSAAHTLPRPCPVHSWEMCI